MTAFSTRGITKLLSYPVRKPGWVKKMAILFAFTLAGMIIPVIPWFFAYGYIAEVIRRAAREDDPELPEWENWNELLMDGLRLTVVSLLYFVPLFLIFGLGFITYLGTSFAMPMLAHGGRSTEWIAPLWFMGGFSVFICSMFCGTLFSLLVGLLLPAAATHLVVKRSLGAFFRIGEWWKILGANLGGYIVFFILLFGLLFVLQILYSLLAWTLVLLPLAFFIPFLLSPYLAVVSGYLWGCIYREAEENLALAATPARGEPAI